MTSGSTRDKLGTVIELELFTREDFDRIIAWVDSPRLLVQWAGTALGLKHPLTGDQLDRYLKSGEGENPVRYIFRVRETGGAVVGHVELDRLSREHRSGSISRVFVTPSRRGHGIGVEMVRRVVDLGFEHHSLRRMDLGVFAFNAPAIRCYEKIGFVREGCLRKAVAVGDEYWDLILMGMLREEWEERR